jgi:ABC-type antimicrobial peptide transport system permease subunit
VVRAVDPAIPVDDIMTMDDVLAASGSRRRLLANLSLTFAIGAIVLAAIGLYGLIAYSTAQRTQELGVRMALGATARTVVADVVGDALGLVAVGLGMGAVACWFLARLMTPLLFGVAATDAVTMLVAGGVLLLVAVLASVVPAARAAAVSPVVAFRGD